MGNSKIKRKGEGKKVKKKDVDAGRSTVKSVSKVCLHWHVQLK